MSQWVKEVSSRPRQDVCQVFDLIKEFLQNAGQNQTVQQVKLIVHLINNLSFQLLIIQFIKNDLQNTNINFIYI